MTRAVADDTPRHAARPVVWEVPTPPVTPYAPAYECRDCGGSLTGGYAYRFGRPHAVPDDDAWLCRPCGAAVVGRDASAGR